MDMAKVLEVAVVGGVIGLDSLALGQFMFSQPIVAAPIVGLLLGDFHTGLLIGVVLELFWLRGLPVGGYVPKNATLAAVLTTGLSLLPAAEGSTPDPAWIAWVFLWVALLLYPAGFLDQWVRRKNVRLIAVAQDASSPGSGLVRAVWMGLAAFFLYYFLTILAVLVLMAPFIKSGFEICSEAVLQGLRFFLFLLPSTGVAVLLTRKDPVRCRILCTVSMIVSFVLLVSLGEPSGMFHLLLFVAAIATLLMEQRIRPA
jgi:mannose/fructose/N-acetylgalactosamine-specific phosphotransferase system component IIC